MCLASVSSSATTDWHSFCSCLSSGFILRPVGRGVSWASPQQGKAEAALLGGGQAEDKRTRHGTPTASQA